MQNKRWAELTRQWRKSGLGLMTVKNRVLWVRKFVDDCGGQADARAELTRDRVDDFSSRYARARRIDPRIAQRAARSALRAWSRLLEARGASVPVWSLSPQRDPRVEEAIRTWKEHGLSRSTIQGWREWVDLFMSDCLRRGREPEAELTHRGIDSFARRYARRRQIDERVARQNAGAALRAWSRALASSGREVPSLARPVARPSLPPLLAEFVRYRMEHSGVQPQTARRNAMVVRDFLTFLRKRGRRLRRVRLVDVDAFVAECVPRYSPWTIGPGICNSLRGFFRFAHATGRLPHDLSSGVVAPPFRADEKPPQGIPWADVRRILRAVDRTTRAGSRDYAILLMMATYGLGAAEIVGLQLDDLDWAGARLRILRRKTGKEIVLPLLPAIAKALVSYLKIGRPRTEIRSLFLRLKAPYVGLTSSTAINRVVRRHARAAGITTTFGSHALRRSHATRHVDQGASLKVVGDILGHRRPTSTSAYVRVALRRLRPLALPVPQ